MYFYPNFKQCPEMFYNLIKSRELILIGAGYNAAQFITHNLSLNIKYICDCDKRKNGKALLGVPIVSYVKLKDENPEHIAVLVTPAEKKSVLGMLYETVGNLDNVFFYTALTEINRPEFAGYFFDHHNALMQTAELLEDDHSKHVLMSVSEKYQCGEYDFSDIYTPDQYYLPEMFERYKNKDKVIIDAGAWQGDTLIKFIELYGSKIKKVFLFEPEPENMNELLNVVVNNMAYDIRVYPCALSDKTGASEFVYLDSRSGASYIKGANAFFHQRKKIERIVQLNTIDALIPLEENVSLIKMDIEGSEMAALRGAEKTIKTHKPCLAVSIYHNPHDYIYIAQYIKQLAPDYKLFIRHHAKHRAETVLYAFI